MKIVIIGAGVIGVTSAYFLAKKGYEVEVLDRRSGPALETSFANAGLLTPSMSDPWNSPGILGTLFKNLGRSDSAFLLRPKAIPSLIGWGLKFLRNSSEERFLKNMNLSADLACYSLKILKELREEHNLKYDQSLRGSLKVFRDQKYMDKYISLAKYYDQFDMPYQAIPKDELIKIEPALESVVDELCGGIFYPDDEGGNAYKFTCEMARIAEEIGVRFTYNVSVEKLETDGKKLSKVVTNSGEYKADLFVLCAGSFSPLLARDIGIDIPIRPVKGYSISVPLKGWNKGPRTPILDDGLHIGLTPLGDILRVAGTAEFTGYDDTLDKDRIQNLYDLLEEVYPDFIPYINKDEVKEWCGFRPMSTDGIPFIGKTKIENLNLNTGHGPLGWTMASGSAKMLCDLISGETPVLNASHYALSRP